MVWFTTAMINIIMDTSLADFSFNVLITCGRNVREVMAPAV